MPGMPLPRIVARPAFEVIGPKTWIGEQDNEQFGRFWQECQSNGLLKSVQNIQRSSGQPGGTQTGGAVLGVSRVEADPTRRMFYYMIAVEVPAGVSADTLNTATCDGEMECCRIPAVEWAVFACHGKIPEALVDAEMYAFLEWLPSSGYQHANAPELEVYPPTDAPYCEFWLPVCQKA